MRLCIPVMAIVSRSPHLIIDSDSFNFTTVGIEFTCMKSLHKNSFPALERNATLLHEQEISWTISPGRMLFTFPRAFVPGIHPKVLTVPFTVEL